MTCLAFMHIPKTAGSSINKVFEIALGDEVVMTHVENHPGYDFPKAFDSGLKYISGHLCLCDWGGLFAELRSKVSFFTFLRHPVAHLASHLRWLDLYNTSEYGAKLRYFEAAIQDEIVRIKSVDFDDALSLDRYLSDLSPAGIRLFDNCQARYFLGRTHVEMEEPIHERHLPALHDTLKSFDFIGSDADFVGSLETLARATGLVIKAENYRENQNVSHRHINIGDADIRQVLLKRVEIDMKLYEYVKNNGATIAESGHDDLLDAMLQA